MPPPTPKSALKTPDDQADSWQLRQAARRHLSYSTAGGCARRPDCRAEPGGAFPRRRRRAGADRRSPGGCDACRRRPASSCAGSPRATRWSRCVTGRAERTSRARSSASTSCVYAGEHGLELEPRRGAWAPRIRAFAESVWPEAECKPLAAPSTTGRQPIRRRHARRSKTVGAGRPRRASGRAGAGWCWRCSRRSTRRRELRCATARGSWAHRALYAGDDTTDLDGFARSTAWKWRCGSPSRRPRARRSSQRAPTSSSPRPASCSTCSARFRRPRRSRSSRTWRRATASSVWELSASCRQHAVGTGAADGGDLGQVHDMRAVDARETARRNLARQLGERRGAEVRAVVGVHAAVVALRLREVDLVVVEELGSAGADDGDLDDRSGASRWRARAAARRAGRDAPGRPASAGSRTPRRRTPPAA